MLTAGEHHALRLWAVWYLEKRSRFVTTVDRAAVEARTAWHVRELMAELEDVARAKGRTVEVSDPPFFREVLEALVDLEVSPADFFARVIRRWGGLSSHGSN